MEGISEFPGRSRKRYKGIRDGIFVFLMTVLFRKDIYIKRKRRSGGAIRSGESLSGIFISIRIREREKKEKMVYDGFGGRCWYDLVLIQEDRRGPGSSAVGFGLAEIPVSSSSGPTSCWPIGLSTILIP
jgi:hypothetical protein